MLVVYEVNEDRDVREEGKKHVQQEEVCCGKRESAPNIGCCEVLAEIGGSITEAVCSSFKSGGKLR